MKVFLQASVGLSLLLFSFVGWTQSGDFILTHHAPKHSEIDNTNFHLTADQNGIICIANRFGILKYDGLEWGFYKTNSSALSISVSSENILYAGCIGEFGKLDFQDHKYQYIPLIQADSITDHFLQTFQLNGMVYFLSERNIYAYRESNSEIRHLVSGDHLNGYVYADQLFVNTGDDRLLSIDQFDVNEATSGRLDWGLIKSSPTGINTLGVSLEGDLYRIGKNEVVPLEQNDKIKSANLTVTDLGWVNDTLVACATVESGVFFLSMTNPKYFEITDYHSGLPDNEIHDLYADANGGVWVAHEFGLTRIAPLYPANSYTNFPGLQGNLIEAQRLHGRLWVNTSLGVFYFKQDTSFKSQVFKEAVTKLGTRKTTTPSPPTATSESDAEVETSSESKKQSGFLKGLFKKKNRSESTEKTEENEGVFKKLFSKESTNESDPQVSYVRRVERIMTGVSYAFEKVPGTDGKFRQLLESPDRILATSHTGIYEITTKSAQLVINEPVRYAFLVPNENKLLVSTETGYLKSYALRNGLWLETSRMYFKDVILNIYTDSRNRVWLAGTSHIYKGTFEGDGFSIDEGYEINNRFYDQLSIWERNGNVYFINSQGYFRFDDSSDRIVRDKELDNEIGLPHHHLQNEKSRVWLYNGKIWNLLNPDGSIQKFDYLGVYPDLKYVSYDEVLRRYWLITQDNQLLAYSPTQVPDLHQNNKLFVKRLTGRKGDIKIVHGLRLAHDQNYLSIELLKTDYLGLLNPEYQYKLNGLNTDWSNWTHANLIDYSYIPPGDYQLIVRARDAFGQIEEAVLLDFSIATPYWMQPWFYLIQVLLLGLVISFTSRLDVEKTHNRLLKHGLSILTLVIIIEFLQSVLGAYMNVHSTPVVDFLVDVGTAILVFPLEWVLRKIMLEGSMSNLKKRYSERFKKAM
jgi:hypothetical protein